MAKNELTDREDVREIVRQKYGEAALKILQGQPSSCCVTDDNCCGEQKAESCCSSTEDVVTGNLYSDKEASEIPEAALLASLGCGNPTALAQLSEGETV